MDWGVGSERAEGGCYYWSGRISEVWESVWRRKAEIHKAGWILPVGRFKFQNILRKDQLRTPCRKQQNNPHPTVSSPPDLSRQLSSDSSAQATSQSMEKSESPQFDISFTMNSEKNLAMLTALVPVSTHNPSRPRTTLSSKTCAPSLRQS